MGGVATDVQSQVAFSSSGSPARAVVGDCETDTCTVPSHCLGLDLDYEELEERRMECNCSQCARSTHISFQLSLLIDSDKAPCVPGCGDLNRSELCVRLGRKMSSKYPTLSTLSDAVADVLLMVLDKSFSETLRSCRVLCRTGKTLEAARFYDENIEFLAESASWDASHCQFYLDCLKAYQKTA